MLNPLNSSSPLLSLLNTRTRTPTPTNRTGKSTKEELHKNEVVARSPLYTVEISVTQFAEWCTREIEVGDIMLEALDEQEKKKDAEVWKTVEKNETLSAILDQQECLVSGMMPTGRANEL